MTITIDLAPELQAELARQAATHGVGIDAYAATLIENAARHPIGPESPAEMSQASRNVTQAIEALKGFGNAHHLSLGGMTIRELRHEARP